MEDETDAPLFIEAQDTVWADVLEELRVGKKQGHWMWFVFPQLAALGRSDISQLYGIHDQAEARAYLANQTLRNRLEQVAILVLGHQGRSAQEIFGDLDAAKLRSSMTLFSAVPDAPDAFTRVVDVFFHGQPCPQTTAILNG